MAAALDKKDVCDEVPLITSFYMIS